MEEIVIPNLDDDDEDDNFPLPAFAKPAFGSPSSSSLNELPGHASPDYFGSHRSNTSTDNLPRPSLSTPARPHLPKSSTSSAGFPTYSQKPSLEENRLGKLNNGSSTSLVTPGNSIGSTPGFLASRKGSKASLSSIRNAFKSAAPVPPVPNLQGTAYPALKNPFSRYNEPASPSRAAFTPQRGIPHIPRKSTASARSAGGRSANSQGSRQDDHVPALPPIPSRSTPSRTGRNRSDSASLFNYRRNGSVGGLDGIEEGSVRTAGEEALRVVWRDFRQSADSKIARLCGRPLNTQPSLGAYLEAGIDASFDTLINSLANSARRHARRVADLLNGWCQVHCEGIGASEVRAHLDRSLGLQMRVEDAAAILSSRKSSAARYILNRALIELVKVTPRENLGEDLGMILEQNAFNAYRSEKIEENAQVSHRKAVSQLQIELLGLLSSTRFLTVSDRFTRELSKYATSAPAKDTEARIEHLLRGMRYLKLRVYPENELELSAEFIQQLSAFFANAHGQSLKCAYAETFTSLLHPCIETATAEVNHPMWSKAIALVLSRALTMCQKPRYWPTAFPLVIVALGVSPREVFLQHWQTCIEAIFLRFKDRSLRTIAMNCFTRLLWIYLNRAAESSTSTRKRLDTLLRQCFTTTGGLYPSELPIDPFVQILHYVMTRQLEYGEEFVTEFMRESDQPGHVDRAHALIRAIGITLRSLEEERPATWPSSSDFTTFSLDGFESSGDVLPEEVTSRQDIADFLKKCSPAIGNRLYACDRAVGHLLLSNDAVTVSTHSSSSAMEGLEISTRKHGDVYVSYPARHDPILRLHAALLDIIPRAIHPITSFSPLANVLCRGTFSADPNVCIAASEAIRRLARDPVHCATLTSTYLQFVFETRHVFRDTFVGSRLLDSQFERVAKLWVDVLKSLVSHQRNEETPQNVPGNLIDKIDGVALYLLASCSVSLRKLASQILMAARDLEGQRRRPSAAFRYSRFMPDKQAVTRVIQLFEATIEESDVATIRALPWMTSSDRHRLDLATADDRVKLFARISQSDNPKDGLLWLAMIPYLVTKVSEQLPGPAQDLRGLVVSAVLRLQGHIASIASVSAGRATQGLRSAPSMRSTSDTGVLADHWRSFLSILCVTMPDQQTPSTPQVQRTKEAVILTPDTIGSPALFHYCTSVLSWEDPRFRDAAVYALGSVGQNLLRPLSEILLGVVRRLADGTKLGVSVRDTRRGTVNGPLWTALAHVFRLISPLILVPNSNHLANLSSIIGFTKHTHALLSDRAVKEDFDLQSLRRSFCIVVENLTNALGKLDSSDRFLGEDMRGAIFKLCYEWCHVGRRPDVAKARESHTLQAAAEGYRGERDRAQYLDDLQAKTKLLSAAAAEAMAGLCQGKLISSTTETTPAVQVSDHMVEPLTVLRWIRGMFSSSSSAHHDTGRKALYALLKYNWTSARLFDEVLHQSFGEGEQFALDSSFFGVVADVIAEGLVEMPIEQVACLSLSKLGHPVPDIRLRALQLTQTLGASENLSKILPAIGSSARNVYRGAQKEMAIRLADEFADRSAEFLSECTTRLSQLEAPRRNATLSIIPPWLSVLDLAPETSDEYQHVALSNLVYLAIRFSDDHLEEICDILIAFAGQGYGGNTTALVKFLFEQGGKRKSADFVGHAQRIIACLAKSDAGDVMFDEICNFVEPSAMASLPDAELSPGPFGSLANLDTLMAAPSSRSQTFSTGQLALLFAGELLPHRLGDFESIKKLPVLLHVALIHADHAGPALREQCQAVLFQVLRAWIGDTSHVAASDTSDSVTAWQNAEHKVASLSRARSTAFWRAEDNGGPSAAFLAPPKMTSLVVKILAILLPLHPRIRQTWGDLALSWATSCPIRHLACRSFQVFRILSPRVSPRMVADTLARLSSTIASSSPEIQAFNLEVIRTFAAIVQELQDIHNYPQIFWCAVACLSTPYENEFIEVIELLSHILDKTNLSDQAVVSHLVSYRPKEWAGSIPMLQPLLLVGLRSNKTDMMAFDLLRRLASCAGDELIDEPKERLLHGFLAALPWMLHSTDSGERNEDLSMMALDLAALAESQNSPSFARLLTSFAHDRFRAKDDFIRQAASLLRDYMPTHALDMLVILLGFVLNDTEWMREKSMMVLKLLLSSPEARAQVATHGNELVQPLLRLVSTRLSAQALDVLDLPVSSDGPLTGDIFGPISPSGWSVPNAKEAGETIRQNVTAVFNTCAKETRAASAHFSVVQFADIRAFANPSQVSLDLPSPPVSGSVVGLSDTGHGGMGLSMANSASGSAVALGLGLGGGSGYSMDNASMGDLVGALHSLNAFFDDGLEEDPAPTRRGHPSSSSNGHARMPSEKRIHDIIRRGRNASISSPIQEAAVSPGSNRPRQFKPGHHHTPSEMTASSSISSIGDLANSGGSGDDGTKRFYGLRVAGGQSGSGSSQSVLAGVSGQGVAPIGMPRSTSARSRLNSSTTSLPHSTPPVPGEITLGKPYNHRQGASYSSTADPNSTIDERGEREVENVFSLDEGESSVIQFNGDSEPVTSADGSEYEDGNSTLQSTPVFSRRLPRSESG